MGTICITGSASGMGAATAARLRAAVEQALVDAVPGLRATIELLPTGMEAVATPMEDDEARSLHP